MNLLKVSILLASTLLFTCYTLDAQSLYHASDFTPEKAFTSGIEGPAVDKKGTLYAVNFGKGGTIGKVTKDGTPSLYLTLPEGSIGNGLRFDPAGNLYVADYNAHQVLKVNKEGEIKVHASCKGCNQPNDLAITRSGTIFISDPNWGKENGNIWRVDTDGSVHLLDSAMGTTNGIEVNPAENRLYVNESVQRKIWVFDLGADGSVSNKRLFAEFPDFGFDGMRCDVKGNLYVTRYGKGSVVKLSPNGQLILEVYLKGKKPSNIAFGGKDGCTAFVTLQDRGCIESFRVSQPGREWKMRK